ncbi:MAG TPA: glycosyltransferase family 39 protein [Blastocatellia bacterium]|nr:glycosyltransferase family 39 protein [Blastocatellia bacterium]
MNNPVTNRARILLILVIVAAAPYFFALGASTLWDSNEAFYTETPREMIESGDYLNPAFNYKPRFNKPPLSYWVVAGLYNLFGVSEGVERFGIAIGAVALIAVAFALARLAFSVEAAAVAALALCLSPRFLMFSRRIFIDIYISLFLGLTLLFFALAEARPRRRRLYLTLMYVSCGLGVMTKGPIAIALPGLAFLTYLAVTRRLESVRRMMLPAGALIVAAIVVPWYAAIYSEHGWSYIESFILRDNLSRYTEPVWGPRRGPFFYVPVIFGDLFPFSLFLPATVWFAWREWRKPPVEARTINSRLVVLMSIWIAVIVLFFSISRNKEDLYILPAYAAAAALTGGAVAGLAASRDDAREKGEEKLEKNGPDKLARFFSASIFAAGLLLAVAGAGAGYIFSGSLNGYALAGAGLIGVAAITGGVAAIILSFTRSRFAAIVSLVVTVAAIDWLFVIKTLPDFERFKPVRAMCETINAQAGPGASAGYYKFASPSMVFYLRRQIFEYYDEDDLVREFSSGKEVYCIMREQDYEAVKPYLPAPTYVLATRPVFQVKLKGIFNQDGLPQVVLISNKGGTSSSQ